MISSLYSLCLPLAIIFIVVLAIIVIIFSKKQLIDTFHNEDLSVFQPKLIKKLQDKGHNVKKKGDKIFVEKGALTSIGLYFKQNDKKLETYRFSSATDFAWILIAFGIIFSMGIVTLIIAVISEINSANFSKETIVPLLKELKTSK